MSALVCGHRGASAYAPENTLPAFVAAAERGAAFVEFDVQRSSDGVLVVIHDETLARTTDVAEVYPGRSPAVTGYPYDDISRLDAGSWFSVEFAGARVPTFREVLECCAAHGLGACVEAKDPARYPGLASGIAAELADVGYPQGPETLMVESFDAGFLREYAALDPSVALGQLVVEFPPDLPRYAAAVNPHHRGVNAARVAAAHDAGLAVWTWTVNEPADLARVRDCGVDAVITDRP